MQERRHSLRSRIVATEVRLFLSSPWSTASRRRLHCVFAFAPCRGNITKAGKRTICFGNFDVYFDELVNVDDYIPSYCPSSGAVATCFDGW